MSESSIDDESDISVCPGKWVSKQSKDKYLPAKGPSKARMAAKEIIAAQRQKEAAKALISLFHPNTTTSDNSDDSLSGASHSCSSETTQNVSSDNEGIVPSNTLVNNTVPKNPVAPENTENNVDLDQKKSAGSNPSNDNIPYHKCVKI